MTQDTIERQMLLKASRERVWDAITKPELLTKWFFTTIDASSLKVGQEFRMGWPEYNASARAVVVEMTPRSRFAYRWEHSDGDHSAPLADTPTTLVTFDLEDSEGGTRLTVIESGIAALPNAASVFSDNSSGWTSELGELQAFVEAA